MKIGLFFGSFNPIHIGHLIIANVMAKNTDLDKVWFIVSPHNPLKSSKSLIHEFDRYEMVRLAIHDNLDLEVSDIEFQLPRPSYTVDTLTYIQEKYPEHEFALIIGEDNLVQFPRWKNHDKILEYFKLYVYPRPRCSESELKSHPSVKMYEAPMMDVSATYIRNTIKDGNSVRYLIPTEVEEYIHRNKLYS
ncbi:nicotinate (nicotinamide) nucleotide adenylyltransferase [Cytophagaceae bacterium ABcell3]|nr:nicotinate (nicotinamide) nucleotide adenylyltransferase [Cytophagaceae bacterium ABcell3]